MKAYARMLVQCELYRISASLEKAAATPEQWRELIEAGLTAVDIGHIWGTVLGSEQKSTKELVARKAVRKAHNMNRTVYRDVVSVDSMRQHQADKSTELQRADIPLLPSRLPPSEP